MTLEVGPLALNGLLIEVLPDLGLEHCVEELVLALCHLYDLFNQTRANFVLEFRDSWKALLVNNNERWHK